MPCSCCSTAARSAQQTVNASAGPMPSGRRSIRARTPSLCSLPTRSALAARPARSRGGSTTISRPIAASALTIAGARKPPIPPAAHARRPRQVEIANASSGPAVRCSGYPGPSGPGTPNAPAGHFQAQPPPARLQRLSFTSQCFHSHAGNPRIRGPPPTCRQMTIMPAPPRMARRARQSPRPRRGSGPPAAKAARVAILPGSTDRRGPGRYLDPHCSPLAKLRLHKEAPHACPQNADSSGARST